MEANELAALAQRLEAERLKRGGLDVSLFVKASAFITLGFDQDDGEITVQRLSRSIAENLAEIVQFAEMDALDEVEIEEVRDLI